jgi:hypothetical protein
MSSRSYLLSIALLVMPLRMYADTVYTYTGNNFDNFDYANTSYSTFDFISLSFDVVAPLAASLSTVPVTPTSYTVSDGVETWNQMTVSESVFIFLRMRPATSTTGTLCSKYSTWIGLS